MQSESKYTDKAMKIAITKKAVLDICIRKLEASGVAITEELKMSLKMIINSKPLEKFLIEKEVAHDEEKFNKKVKDLAKEVLTDLKKALG